MYVWASRATANLVLVQEEYERAGWGDRRDALQPVVIEGWVLHDTIVIFFIIFK